MGVVTNLECPKVNGSFPCLCCEELKVELQKVISELKSVVEIAKALKEDQGQLSRKVWTVSKCSSAKHSV
jgi:hypothetical protein